MKFFTVCTLPKFHPHHVHRLLSQLQRFYSGDIEFYCYTDRPDEFNSNVITIPIRHSKCIRQWYKIDFFGPDIVPDVNEPIIVMDVDWSIIRNIDHLIDVPIAQDEFISTPRWWREDDDPLPISGGFYKFIPASCKYMWDTFYENPEHWQEKYRNPDHIFSVQGEQDFVWEHASKAHKMITLPGYKFARVMNNLGPEVYNQIIEKYKVRYERIFGHSYNTNGEWNERILMVQG